MRLHEREMDREDLERLTGDTAAAGGIREVVLANGPERSVRALEFRTGTGLAFDVLVDRAMDLGAAEFRGQSIAWRAAVGVQRPGLRESGGDPSMAWMRSVNGLLATGGLDHISSPQAVDASQYNLPSRPKISHGLHGRVTEIPARLIGFGEQWQEGRCTLWAEGEIRQAALFAENLELRRRIESDLGGNEIRIRDTVRNRGFDSTPHMMLYHFNFGWPLLEAGASIEAPVLGTRWRTPEYSGQSPAWNVIEEPGPGANEQVFEQVLAADGDGLRTVCLLNWRLGVGIEMEWSARQLPCFYQWMLLRAGVNVLGLEPATHHIEGDQAARDDGSMIWLEHGEERCYNIRLRVLAGKEQLQRAATKVAATLKHAQESSSPA